MLFALICRDRKGAIETRKANRDKHLEYIEKTGVVTLAGPFLDGGEMCGSLVVIDVADRAGAEAWAASEPYHLADLFENVDILEWKRVVG
ncbi:YciI family protein [Paracoccus sp. p4-l81]|uniref:YciI family protein n=1 Tax=Paracoccus sp. p4-l81 TaxID=3342806 RepID=UPI0035B8A1B6